MTDLEAIRELSDIDLELMRANKRLKSLPEATLIAEISAKKQEVSLKLEKVQVVLDTRMASVEANDEEMSKLLSREAELKERIAGSTDYRVLNNVGRDLEGIEKRKEKLNHARTETLDPKLEEARKAKEQIELALALLEKKEIVACDKFKEVSEDILNSINLMNARRAELEEVISAGLLKRYNTLRETKGGIAVCTLLQDKFCSACRVELIEGRIARLKQEAPFSTCPECGRIMLIGGEE